MKSQENIAKRGPVIWKEYEEKLNQLDILFKFMEYAVERLSNTKRREFVQTLKNEALERTSRVWDERSDPDLKEIPGIAEYSRKLLEKKVKAKYRSKKHTQYAEWVYHGIISAEILFRVTVFEDFLKHVHAVILSAEPTILARANPKKSRTYKDMFSRSFDQFKEEEICCEVEELKGMANRLNYFRKYLRIEFANYQKPLVEISGIRNRIVHRHPLEAIAPGEATNPLDELQRTVANVIRASMRLVFQKGQSKYPDHFQ